MTETPMAVSGVLSANSSTHHVDAGSGLSIGRTFAGSAGYPPNHTAAHEQRIACRGAILSRSTVGVATVENQRRHVPYQA